MKIKNIAGNPVSIFLFRFVIHGDGISFVLNESIAEDMYQDIDQLIAGIGQSFVVCSGRTLENHKLEHREADFTICLAKLVQFRDCADVRIPGVLHPS